MVVYLLFSVFIKLGFRLVMKIEELKNEPLFKEFAITLPANEIDVLYNDKIKQVATNITIEGFRKGKAPAPMIQRKYGNQLYKELVEEQVDKLCRNATKDLKVFGSPQIANFKAEKGADLSFSLSVELYPTIELPNFKSIVIQNPTISLSDEEFKASKEETLSEIYKNGLNAEVATEKCELLCSIRIEDLDGTPLHKDTLPTFITFKDSEDQKIKSLVPVDVALKKFIGAHKGDHVDLEIELSSELPPMYSEEQKIKDFIGKKVKMHLDIEHILQVEPDYNNLDHIANALGCEKSAIDEKIRQIIEQRFNSDAFGLKRIMLFDALEKALTFDVPPSIYRTEASNLLEQILKAKEEAEELKSKTDSELRDYANKYALRRIRIGMMLSKYADEKKIQVTNEEYRRAVISQARRYGNIGDDIVKAYMSNEKLMQQLAGSILEDKSVASIMSEVDLQDKKYSLKELDAELESVNKEHFV